VLARGTNPLDPAVKALKLLQDEEGNLKVPVAFVTNACNRSEDKARQIGKWFNMQVNMPQSIFLYTEYQRRIQRHHSTPPHPPLPFEKTMHIFFNVHYHEFKKNSYTREEFASF
jgi:hypothetical protein